jgi:hypothetical protein
MVSARGAARIWIRRAYADAKFVELLASPDSWFSDPEFVLVKDTLKTKVGRLSIRIGAESRAIYVKRYNAFSLRYRVGSLFSRSAARRSLAGAEVLAAAGIDSAQPIASVEIRRCGMLASSFFVAEEIAGAQTSDRFWRNILKPAQGSKGLQRRRAYLAGLAGLFARLHRQRIYHGDLKDANIMAFPGESGPRFVLLDLEGVRRCSVISRRRRVKNLVQLYRTLGKSLRRPEQLFFLKNYLGGDFANRPLRRRFVNEVLNLAQRVDRRKARPTIVDAAARR